MGGCHPARYGRLPPCQAWAAGALWGMGGYYPDYPVWVGGTPTRYGWVVPCQVWATGILVGMGGWYPARYGRQVSWQVRVGGTLPGGVGGRYPAKCGWVVPW